MGKRNQPRRQKCAARKYTESEVNAMLRKATEGVARHNVYTTVAACGLTLHTQGLWLWAKARASGA